MTRWRIAIAAAGFAVAAVHAQAVVHVTVTGEVDHPGEIALQGEPRLADVVTVAHVNRDAYVIGAAWLRPGLRDQQTRLKAGLLFELGLIARSTDATRGGEPLAALAHGLHDWIGAMPVTGRRVVATLEPHAVQVSLPDNFLVKDGDRLIYPSRPGTISVVGAVEHACELPQVGLRNARDYLGQCPSSRFADPDLVYVIQPDGSVFERGIALWNLSPAMPIAPGAILYVPIDRRAIERTVDERFNREMADFIATQPMGGTWVTP